MKKNKYKNPAVLVMAGMLATTGLLSGALTIPGSIPIVHAAQDRSYDTRGGIATLGTGTAGIIIKGTEGQSMVGKRFHVYQLFYAENASDGESINYTFHPSCEQAIKNVAAKGLSKGGKQVRPEDVTEYMALDYIQSLNTNPTPGTQADPDAEGAYSLFRYFIEDVRNELVRLNVDSDTVNVKTVRSDHSVRLNGLDYGYYLVDEVSTVSETHAAGSLCMVDTANPMANISLKSDYPSVIKKIQEDDENPDITDPDGWNDIADYEIGQKVPYRYESILPDMNGYDTFYYAWHDKMNPALSFQAGTVKIQMTGKNQAGQSKTYTLQKGEYEVDSKPGNDDTFRVSIPDIKLVADREFGRFNDQGENVYGQTVHLTYEAVLNDQAADHTGRPGFENDVRLEFTNDPDSDGSESTGFTPWDTTVCYTYCLNVQKQNDHAKALAGAKFRLYSDKACKNEVYVKAGVDGYLVINRDQTGGKDHTGGSAPAEAQEMVSAETGTFTIYGLDSGVYYLKETDAPDGYRRLLDPIVLTVKPTYTSDRDSYVKGEGETNQVLKSLTATAHIASFFNGATQESNRTLQTDAGAGSANLTVINQAGKSLPATGTPAVIILLLAGTGIMTAALVRSKRENGQEKNS